MNTSPPNPRHRLFPLLAACVLLASLVVSSAAACPNCKNNLPNGAKESGGTAVGEPQTAQGYAWSIYLMLAVPLAMVSGLGATAYFISRRVSAQSHPHGRA